MILTENLTMRFGDFFALSNMSCRIPSGCVWGLIGSNGAGKSTFLRLISGIYRPTAGQVKIDGEWVYDNPAAKEKIAFVPDELYFLPQSNMQDMAGLYRAMYKNFSRERFAALTAAFGLDAGANINTFSKGMRRQAATILALAAMPQYLFFDETFDGLDPVMRNMVKDVIERDVRERGTTVIVSSHSLRELEDTCDQLALLHKGGLVLESQVKTLKTGLFKVQMAFDHPVTREDFAPLSVQSFKQEGSVTAFITSGDRTEVEARLRAMQPLFVDVLPLNLEEMFIYEMEALGYAMRDVL